MRNPFQTVFAQTNCQIEKLQINMNQFLNHSCLRIQAISAENLRSHQEETNLKTNRGRFCAWTSISPQLVSRQLQHEMFSIQYFRHKLHQTPKITVFSSSLAQTISFIFRHAMNRNKEHKICFNGEHLRQHNTSQRCHFSHEYVQYPIHRLQEQIKGCAYGNSYHYKTSTLWKPEHITLEQSKDHRLCIKKLI